ncbi:hypothetical protein Pmani_006868 [Petrolisthes manimaculis]|uniref:PiggyBac transposable element-derived protein domain-containing protein n=1 Tax=Petrolisthes manimaculis TaxID=1843537 RepID=A0AAE1UKP3_9EUCA|nr:hypothetical protein Pmani_006868 [Petrolisthes manimaculis]
MTGASVPGISQPLITVPASPGLATSQSVKICLATFLPVTTHPVHPSTASSSCQVHPSPAAAQLVRGADGLEWSDGHDFQPDIHPFDNSASGVTFAFPVESDGSEIEYFEAYFDEVMGKIAEETNRQHAYLLEHTQEENVLPDSRRNNWYNTTIRELYSFLALIIVMPHSKRHLLNDYWKKYQHLGKVMV